MVHADHSSACLTKNPFAAKPFSYPGGEPVGTPRELIRAMGPNLSTKIVVMQPDETRTFQVPGLCRAARGRTPLAPTFAF